MRCFVVLNQLENIGELIYIKQWNKWVSYIAEMNQMDRWNQKQIHILLSTESMFCYMLIACLWFHMFHIILWTYWLTYMISSRILWKINNALNLWDTLAHMLSFQTTYGSLFIVYICGLICKVINGVSGENPQENRG